MNQCTYLLPIRRSNFSADESFELARYFQLLGRADCEVLIVDGSPPEIFEQHRGIWSALARHEKVDRRFGYLNDKVNGIHTGVELAGHEKIILADDDIRYTPANIAEIAGLLESFEVVRPQNYLSPLPSWARMEAARMLINRATLCAADYPGTCAFRRETILRVGHYDGDVLFDNEEIVRHFARAGATISYANDLFIEKRAPTLRKWREQRPRQAYEDFALRTKTAVFAALLPAVITCTLLGGRTGALLSICGFMAVAWLLALRGWLRGGARKFFPPLVILWAPLWVAERSISTFWAFYWFFRHGGYPFGEQLLSKGVGRDWFVGGRMAANKERGRSKKRPAHLLS
ncbi:MAG: glycosyltransferase [Chthoniobacterales bacterium]